MPKATSPEPSDHSASPSRGKWIFAGVWLVGFTLFFFTRPMPNLGGSFAETRSEAWSVIPWVILDWVFPVESDSPPADQEEIPSGWRFLPERLALWTQAAGILCGAWGIGYWILRVLIPREALSALERFVFAVGVGLSVISLIVLGCGLAGFLSRGFFLAILSLPAITAIGLSFRKRELLPKISWKDFRQEIPWGIVLAIAPFLLAMLCGGVSPSTDFDVKEYHFGGPKEFFQTGRISFLPHNVYTSFPFLTEMLTLLGMVLKQDFYRGSLLGKCVLMTLIPLTGLGILAAGTRWFGKAAGWWGMLVWLTTPWAVRIGIIAYAEGGLSCYVFLASVCTLLACERSREQQDGIGLFVLAGFFAGSAMACKYTGLVSAVFPCGVAILDSLFRDRNVKTTSSPPVAWWKILAGFVLGVAVAIGPWLLKNLAETGNPVYPLAWTIFGGEDWNADRNAQWKNAHSPPHHKVSSFFVLENGALGWVFDITAVNDWLSPLLYGFAPLVLLIAKARRTSFYFWAIAGWLFLSWWAFTHRLDRFWVPMLPLIAVLAGGGAAWTSERFWRMLRVTVVAAAVVFNFVLVFSLNAGYIAWLTDLEAAGQFTARITAREISLLNEMHEQEPIHVLSVGEAEIFDARFPIIYNTVFDESIFEQWTAEPNPDQPPEDWPLKPADEILEKLRDEGVTHILVNWREILRYRPTYGYARFVHPGRFQELVEMGVLDPPEILGQMPFENLSPSEKKDVLQSDWLKSNAFHPVRDVVVLSAVYRVRKETHDRIFALAIEQKRLPQEFPMGGVTSSIGGELRNFALFCVVGRPFDRNKHATMEFPARVGFEVEGTVVLGGWFVHGGPHPW